VYINVGSLTTNSTINLPEQYGKTYYRVVALIPYVDTMIKSLGTLFSVDNKHVYSLCFLHYELTCQLDRNNFSDRMVKQVFLLH